MNIKEMKEIDNGKRIVGFYVAKAVEQRTTKTDKPYIDMTLSDSTGDVNAKWWDIKSFSDADAIVAGKMVKIEGTLDRYQDVIQLTIKQVRLTVEKDGVKIEDYVRSAPIEVEDMMADIRTYIGKIEDPFFKKIVIELVSEKVDKLKYFPAAMKNHHALRGGLLYHTTSMLKLAEHVADLYPNLNRGLLYAGVIIHDLEKVTEMNSNEMGIVSDYTTEGKLFGHISLGIINLKKVAEKVGAPEEQTNLLMHMVLAHHGKKEYGSPILPLIPEAEALHHIDNIDAKMNTFASALEGVEPGNFSERIFSLDNRQAYKANL